MSVTGAAGPSAAADVLRRSCKWIVRVNDKIRDARDIACANYR